MGNSVSKKILWVIYVIALFLVIPVICSLLVVQDVFSYQGYIQVYFSGPGLFVLGLFLLFYYKKRTLGLILMIFSISLLIAIAYELLAK